jgi:glycolate oxidase FAD binding subunit
MASSHSEFAQESTGVEDQVAIDRMRPRFTLTPRAPEELADILATAEQEEHGVAPVGGGTKLALGNPPARLDLAISTSALKEVLHYEPDDLTLSVQAGMSFAEVQSILSERGQTLPVETPDDERATIGGMIATALAGPRRLGCGTLRDLLIGIAVAYPNGAIGKAGGMVVKNVSGFDLMRLHLGALGTLGIVVSANFKVLPKARHEASLISTQDSLGTALKQAESAKRARLRPIAVDVFNDQSAWRTAVRFEGRRETVEIGVDALRGAGSWTDQLDAEDSVAWWKAYVRRQSLVPEGETVMLRCGFAPKEAEGQIERFAAALAAHDISQEIWMITPELGSAVVRFKAKVAPEFSLRPLQESLLNECESVHFLLAPAELKRDLDVWGPAPETISVMHALKAQFDPKRVLNPGRFVDRI